MSNSASPGFYSFWFWNDALAADEMRWQVQQTAAQGTRGFLEIAPAGYHTVVSVRQLKPYPLGSDRLMEPG